MVFNLFGNGRYYYFWLFLVLSLRNEVIVKDAV